MTESTRIPRTGSFPTRDQLLAFINHAPGPINKRDIVRAFHLRSIDRIPLKAMLKALEHEGLLARPQGFKRRVFGSDSLPSVIVAKITGLDAEGDLLAQPFSSETANQKTHTLIRLQSDPRPGMSPGIGERCLLRLNFVPAHHDQADHYQAKLIKRLPQDQQHRLLCRIIQDRSGALRAESLDRGNRSTYYAFTSAEKLGVGTLVMVEALPNKYHGLPTARVIKPLGMADSPGVIGKVALAAHDIPNDFSSIMLSEAEIVSQNTPEKLSIEQIAQTKREDLRTIPLVTIDGSDAKDFDDAVWAAPDEARDNRGGFVLLVAIADVAHYVRPGSVLDQEAEKRGNSVYLPDQVVPMLPEALSNDCCSLQPCEERFCFVVRIRIGPDGKKLDHSFRRAVMRSVARLTYDEVQRLYEAKQTISPEERETINLIRPLYAAYRALEQARKARGTLELDLPEIQVLIDEQTNQVSHIDQRHRFDSHKLIEEFMILANVCAAETLEAKGWPCLYRVHDHPDPAKLQALSNYVAALPKKFKLRLIQDQSVQPRHFTQLLSNAQASPFADLLQDLVLRSQAQAVYTPKNIGHFGLGLQRYAHFTSPIRRYSDLIIHRALIAALQLGEDGLPQEEAEYLTALGAHISMTERRAASAERDAIGRYAAAFMQEKIGTIYPGRVVGIGKFGLFVRLKPFGIEGLIPLSTLPDDRYDYDPDRHMLKGRRRRHIYTLGQAMTVRVVQADGLVARLTLALETSGEPLSIEKTKTIKKTHSAKPRKTTASRMRALKTNQQP